MPEHKVKPSLPEKTWYWAANALDSTNTALIQICALIGNGAYSALEVADLVKNKVFDKKVTSFIEEVETYKEEFGPPPQVFELFVLAVSDLNHFLTFDVDTKTRFMHCYYRMRKRRSKLEGESEDVIKQFDELMDSTYHERHYREIVRPVREKKLRRRKQTLK